MEKIKAKRIHSGFYELNVLATKEDGTEQKVTIERGCGDNGKFWQTNISKPLFKSKKDGVDFITSIFLCGFGEFDDWTFKTI
jgi:hypothetical protein